MLRKCRQATLETATSEDDTATEEALISSEEAGALVETEVILAEGDVYSDDDISIFYCWARMSELLILAPMPGRTVL